MITVKFITSFTSSTKLKENWKKMTPNMDAIWNNIQIVDDNYNNKLVNYIVIINKPWKKGYDWKYDYKTIRLRMEPSLNNYGVFELTKKFLFNHHYKFDYNNLEWHISKSYSQLMTEDINKSKDLSVIVSALYSFEGHKKRINLIRYLDNQESFNIAIYGRCASLNFKKYLGELHNGKDDGLLPYKYHIGIENSSEKGYFTEKLIDSILSECLTFYWGAPDADEYFPNAFIRLPLTGNHQEDMNIIINAINNNEYEKRLEYIRIAKKKILNEMQFFPRICDMINVFESKLFDQIIGENKLVKSDLYSFVNVKRLNMIMNKLMDKKWKNIYFVRNGDNVDGNQIDNFIYETVNINNHYCYITNDSDHENNYIITDHLVINN